MSRLSRAAVLLAASSLVVALGAAACSATPATGSAQALPSPTPAVEVDAAASLLRDGMVSSVTDRLVVDGVQVDAATQIEAWLADWKAQWAQAYRAGSLHVVATDAPVPWQAHEGRAVAGFYSPGHDAITVTAASGERVFAHELGHWLQAHHPQHDELVPGQEWGADCIAAVLTADLHRACTADDMRLAAAVIAGAPLPFEDPRTADDGYTGTRPSRLTADAVPGLATPADLLNARIAAGLVPVDGAFAEAASRTVDYTSAERTSYPGVWIVDGLLEATGATVRVVDGRVYADADVVSWHSREHAAELGAIVFDALAAEHPGLPACWQASLVSIFGTDGVCSGAEFARGVELLAPAVDPRVVAWLVAADDPNTGVLPSLLASTALAAAGLTADEVTVVEVGDEPVSMTDFDFGFTYCPPVVAGVVVMSTPPHMAPSRVERAEWCAD